MMTFLCVLGYLAVSAAFAVLAGKVIHFGMGRGE